MADLVSEDLKEREEGLVSKASSPMRKLVADLNCSLYSCRRMMPLEDWGDCEQSDTSSLRPNLSWLACDSSKGQSKRGWGDDLWPVSLSFLQKTDRHRRIVLAADPQLQGGTSRLRLAADVPIL